MSWAGPPSELFGALLFLASDASTYVNGQMIIGGDAVDKAWWTVWIDGILMEIPVEEGFNTAHRANAAHLQDWRHYDGYFYLLYAGNTENESFWTRGHNRLGLARSKDLIKWEVPPLAGAY